MGWRDHSRAWSRQPSRRPRPAPSICAPRAPATRNIRRSAWRCGGSPLHMAFYRDVVKAHLDLDPDYIRPLAAVILRFEMPWSATVLEDFEKRRTDLAARGVFHLSDYLEEVLQPLWSYWGLDGRTPREEETRKAQVQLRRYR